MHLHASLGTSERKAVVKARFGQGRFRDALIGMAGAKCWMCGIEGRALLIASHIKRWAACDADATARGNPDNGLLLSALWDAAFDTGLLSFGTDWRIVAAKKLPQSATDALWAPGAALNILPEQFRPPEGKDSWNIIDQRYSVAPKSHEIGANVRYRRPLHHSVTVSAFYPLI